MKKNVFLVMLAFVSLLFVSCGDGAGDSSLDGESAAEILSYSLDGAKLVGTPDIDSAAMTVAVTVEPVDLSAVTPSVTLSNGATYTADDLVDGEVMNYTVTAENGDESVWKITVTVTPGVSFTYGTTYVSLMKGYIDSEDDERNTELGEGEPVGIFQTSELPDPTDTTTFLSFENDYNDKGGDEGEPEDGKCYFTVEGNDSSGDKSTLFSEFRYEYNSESSPYVYIAMDSDSDVTFKISEYGSVGKYINGTFSCPDVISEGEDIPDPVSVTDGFFKVLRLSDNYIIDLK